MIQPQNRLLELQSRAGGHEEFVALWKGAARRVQAFIRTLVFNRSDAEELCQEVGAAAWENFGDFDRSKDFLSWVYGIARNKVLMFQRHPGRRMILDTEQFENLERDIREKSRTLEWQFEALKVCLSRLSERDRALICHRYAADTSPKACAAESGRSLESIYKSLQRIRKRLFDCMSRRAADGRQT